MSDAKLRPSNVHIRRCKMYLWQHWSGENDMLTCIFLFREHSVGTWGLANKGQAIHVTCDTSMLVYTYLLISKSSISASPVQFQVRCLLNRHPPGQRFPVFGDFPNLIRIATAAGFTERCRRCRVRLSFQPMQRGSCNFTASCKPLMSWAWQNHQKDKIER